MTVTLKRVALPGGPMLEYTESGLGTAILFLHGYTDSWRSFEPVLVHLPKSLRAIALSQPGHGNSERPGNGYRCRHFADDVLAFLNEMEIQRAVIVGHCMGSQVALSFAAKCPERVSGLVVIGAFGTMRNNAVLQDLCGTWLSCGSRIRSIGPLCASSRQARSPGQYRTASLTPWSQKA